MKAALYGGGRRMERQQNKMDVVSTGAEQDFVDEYGFPVTFPESVLTNMRKTLKISAEVFDTLHLYFDAANNLYARIPLKKLREIYNSQNSPILEDDFLDAAEIISHERNHYTIVSPSVFSEEIPKTEGLERELVAEHLYALDDEDYLATAKAQDAATWYIPDREQLLKYADDRYTEETPQRLALANFLRNTQRKSICPPEEIAEELQDLFRMDLSMQDVLEDAQRLGVRFENQRDLRMFIKLCIDLSYHSRRYAHCGHTQAELGLVKKSVGEMMDEIDYDENYRDPLMEMGSMLRSHFAEKKTVTGKPAKNASCPCGSGRKYKNCCGKGK